MTLPVEKKKRTYNPRTQRHVPYKVWLASVPDFKLQEWIKKWPDAMDVRIELRRRV